MELTLLSGSAARERLETAAFRQRWQALYRCCPWATACQHPDFVLPWYRLYGRCNSPVVVMRESAGGELLGLLTLAMEAGGVRLIGAGGRQAEYQAWLGLPDGADAFMRDALVLLHAEFPGVDLRLRYLPPGIPLGWSAEGLACGRRLALHACRRPLMHLDGEAMARQRAKKNHRQNYNRLGRIGEVAFRKVEAGEQFAAIFDEICDQYDFRQGALHHQLPFRDDPLKKPFYLELHRRGLLHVTVLTVGGVLAASHIGLLSEGHAVHLGINTHSPVFAAHSPGNLLLAMLGVQLAGEGLPQFDLTPGGDEYKEHFATEHDLVFELVMYGSARRRLVAELATGAARLAKAGLRRSGYRPADVLACLDRLGHLAQRTAQSLRGRSDPPGARAMCDYRRRLDPHGPERVDKADAGGPGVARNSLAHALCFDAHGAPLGYWQFLHQAMGRMERSQQLYSQVRDGKLLVFCWLAMGGAAILPSELQASGQTGAVMLYDMYVHPVLGRTDGVRTFIEGLLCELRGQGLAGQLQCRCRVDAELRQVLEASGFGDGAAPAPDQTGRTIGAPPWRTGA